MKVDKSTQVNIRFYGGGEFEAGVGYEAGDTIRIEVDRSIVKGLNGLVDLTVQKAKLREGVEGKFGEPVLKVESSELVYVKDPADVVKIFYPAGEGFQAEIDKAKKLYNADLDTVILVSLTQGTSESYNRVSFWEKEEESKKEKLGKALHAKKGGKKKSSSVVTD